MTPSAIWIVCEGEGCPANPGPTCQMCGHKVLIRDDGMVAHHARKDILAMIDRGDFGHGFRESS